MSGYVLDASALLALLRNETGANAVADILDGALMSTVNVAEVVQIQAQQGVAAETSRMIFDSLPIIAMPPSREIAIAAGAMETMTRRKGLSLGDRFCLALAHDQSAIAVTADRAWTEIATDVGVEVQLIR